MTMFRWFLVSLSVLVALWLVAVCQQSTNAQQLSSFKGWELYSWKDKDGWKFSLLHGTNRNKFIEEITDPKATMTLPRLKAQLEKLAPGEEVFWTDGLNVAKSTSQCRLQMPDAACVKEVETVCSTRKLHLVKLLKK